MGKITGAGGLMERAKGWKNFSKRLAKDYPQAAASLLEKALLAENALERSRCVVGACAKLTAFRNRYGGWRDREAGRLLAWNSIREGSLRALRDSYLKNLLKHYFSILNNDRLRFAAVANWRYDVERRGILLKLRNSVENGGDYLEMRVLAMELYRKSKGTRIEQDVIAIGRRLKEDIGAAKEKADDLELLLRANNPFYVAEELEKTADPYLTEFVRLFRLAVERLSRSDVWRALSFFQAARKELGARV